MDKAFVGAAAIAVVVLVGLPLLALVGGEEENGAGDPASGGEPAAQTAAPMPDASAAPPEWDAQRLAGTAWRAGFDAHPDEALRAEMTLEYRFLPGGRMELEILRNSEEDGSDHGGILRDMLLSHQGTYEVDYDRIHLTADLFTGHASRDVIHIRGRELYYHGIRMRPVE